MKAIATTTTAGKEAITLELNGSTEVLRKSVDTGKYNTIAVLTIRTVAWGTNESGDYQPRLDEFTAGWPSRDRETAAKNNGGFKTALTFDKLEDAKVAAELLGAKVTKARRKGRPVFQVPTPIKRTIIDIERAA